MIIPVFGIPQSAPQIRLWLVNGATLPSGAPSPWEHPLPREHLHKCHLLSTSLVCKLDKLWLSGLQEVGIRTICLVWCLFN